MLGWNSWNHFACNISESLIKETVDALISTGLADAGYKYVNLDDCWQANARGADGTIGPDPERFPSGLKALGDYIHERGLYFGIYSSAGFKVRFHCWMCGLGDLVCRLVKRFLPRWDWKTWMRLRMLHGEWIT